MGMSFNRGLGSLSLIFPRAPALARVITMRASQRNPRCGGVPSSSASRKNPKRAESLREGAVPSFGSDALLAEGVQDDRATHGEAHHGSQGQDFGDLPAQWRKSLTKAASASATPTKFNQSGERTGCSCSWLRKRN